MLLIDLYYLLKGSSVYHGRTRTLRALFSTYRSIMRFAGADLSIVEIFTPGWLASYEKHLYSSGLSDNSVSFYMRTLRSMYNQAVQRGFSKPVPWLFSNVFTGTGKTVKRAIEPDMVKALCEADLSDDPGLSYWRDIFVLCFYMQGISFVDLAFLRKSSLHGNLITYRRRKTGSAVTLHLLPEAMHMLRRCESLDVDSPYLMPFITKPDKAELQYASTLRVYNRRLKLLARRLGITVKLTSYVARHSWATTAYHFGVPVSVVSQAMGHSTEEVTRIYLASFDTDVMKAANQTVLDAVMNRGKEETTEKDQDGQSENRLYFTPEAVDDDYFWDDAQ